jgi:hypothetical protein
MPAIVAGASHEQMCRIGTVHSTAAPGLRAASGGGSCLANQEAPPWIPNCQDRVPNRVPDSAILTSHQRT